MFQYTAAFDQDISGWDVSKGTNFVSINTTGVSITFDDESSIPVANNIKLSSHPLISTSNTVELYVL